MNYLLFAIVLFENLLRCLSTHQPTTITNYIGKWYSVYADPNIYIYSGYGSMTNTYNDQLSSKKMQRMAGYGYKQVTDNSTYYVAYLETIPLDGSYWMLHLNNITNGFFKYSIYNDRSGGIWIWGNDKKSLI